MTVANQTITSTSSISSTASTANSQYKALQNQLTMKQNRLDKISSDNKLDDAEKAKEQQKIQQQIDELNRKIKQMQLEQQNAKEESRKQAREVTSTADTQETQTDKNEKAEKKEKLQELRSEEAEEENKNVAENQTAAIAKEILSSNFEMQQALIQEGVYKQTERKSNLLETEIKADERTGNDTTNKEEKLEELKEKVNIITEIKEAQTNTTDPYTMNPNAKIIIREPSRVA